MLNENMCTIIQDASKYSNHDTLYSPQWVPDENAILGSALSFDGVDNYISIPNSIPLQFGTSSFTISFWLKSTSTTGSFVSKGVFSWGAPGYCLESGDTGRIDFLVIESSTNRWMINTAGNVFNYNNWLHIVSVWDWDAQTEGEGTSVMRTKLRYGYIIFSSSACLAFHRVHEGKA